MMNEVESEYEMVGTTVQSFPGVGVGCPSWLGPSAPLFLWGKRMVFSRTSSPTQVGRGSGG